MTLERCWFIMPGMEEMPLHNGERTELWRFNISACSGTNIST
jgi:hypothetical protein